MKILSPNKNGQIVIPAKIRRDLGIDETTLLMAEVQNGCVMYVPVSKINQKTIVSSKKIKKKYTYADAKKFMFSGSKTLSEDIDKILYS